MKKILVLAIAAVGFLAQSAHATVISFNLTGQGFSQDSPVATNLFQNSGLLLSSGVVTACGGICISTPASNYTGALTGRFVDASSGAQRTANNLFFDIVIGNAVVQLYDLSSNFIANAVRSGSDYTYSGSTDVAYFVANLNYDGIYSMSFDLQQTASVPAPGALALLGLGLLGLGGLRRKKAA